MDKSRRGLRIGVVVVTAAVASLQACGKQRSMAGGEGTMQMALEADGSSGTHYRLRAALLTIAGASPQSVSSEDFLTSSRIQVELQTGAYSIRLNEGWFLERKTTAGTEPVDSGLLISQNPVAFAIAERTATPVTFRFQVGGDVIDFGKGVLVVGIGVDEVGGGRRRPGPGRRVRGKRQG